MKDYDGEAGVLKDAGITFTKSKNKFGIYIKINEGSVNKYLKDSILRDRELERQKKLYPEHIRGEPPTKEVGLQQFLMFITQRIFARRVQWAEYFKTLVKGTIQNYL